MSKNIFQKIYYKDLNKLYSKFDGIILDNTVSDIKDLYTYFNEISQSISQDKKLLITYHNYFWEPILSLATKLGLRKRVETQNWLDEKDIENILNLTGFEKITTQKRFFGLTMATVAKLSEKKLNNIKKLSVSIVIPARNEQGNIKKILPSIPKFGRSQEIIFVEGNSTDNTRFEIEKEIEKKHKKYITIKFYTQGGVGKADAVWKGFDNATGDILMIYDADRTVDGDDLPKFYNALTTGIGEFANGSRLVYPMEKMAMQTLNKLANKIFSIIFTWVFGQRFKDTLCGTKALFRKDYLYMKKNYKRYFKIDPFGDFALIFGAIRKNLKVIEIPVRYKQRSYGSTNISRFKHGLILLRMVVRAFFEFKFF